MQLTLEQYVTDDKKNISKLREYKVVKSNDLIRKARFDLTMQEQKIILYLISKIKSEDIALLEYNFEITEFCKVCGIKHNNGKNYQNIKSAIKCLADKSIWLKLDNNKETVFRWINKAWIYGNTGTIRIRFDEDLQPYLLNLKQYFTQYELLYILGMKSQYSIRIYELMKSYEYTKTLEVDIEQFKKDLFAEKYNTFKDFRVNVLEKSINEINNLSDITVKYEFKKSGRKIAKMKFYIFSKKTLEDRIETWDRIEKSLNSK